MNKKQSIIAIISLVIALGIGGFMVGILIPVNPAGAVAAPEQRILVKIAPDISTEEVAALDRKFGDNLEDVIPQIGVRVVHVPASVQSEIIAKLKKLRQVQYVETDAIAQAFLIPNDPYYSNEWGMEKVSAPEAWDQSIGDAINIAILDTGIDYNHSDLKSKIVLNRNFTTTNTALDRNGHGTHVAGIAAATTNNARGVAGLGFNAKLLNGKVLADNGSGYYSWIANGIVWAADSGANVINMSLGGPSSSQTLSDAINYAWQKGAVIVAAAGNSATSTPTYPAFYDHVLAVAAVDNSDARASFSNYGTWVDVAAPGVDILSTYPRVGKSDRYAWMSGTSMASPYVAGLAGLVWATSYGTDNQSVRDRIESTADPLSDASIGTGRINAAHAVSTP